MRSPKPAAWQAFFEDRELPADAPDYIRQAGGEIDYMNLTREERAVIDRRQKAEDIYIAVRYGAYLDGLEAGRREAREPGYTKAKEECARKAMARQLDLFVIAYLTGLPDYVIKRLNTPPAPYLIRPPLPSYADIKAYAGEAKLNYTEEEWRILGLLQEADAAEEEDLYASYLDGRKKGLEEVLSDAAHDESS